MQIVTLKVKTFLVDRIIGKGVEVVVQIVHSHQTNSNNTSCYKKEKSMKGQNVWRERERERERERKREKEKEKEKEKERKKEKKRKEKKRIANQLTDSFPSI
jgi:signal transduction histidine kinase